MIKLGTLNGKLKYFEADTSKINPRELTFEEIDAFNTVKGLMWRVLPQLIKPTTFIVYVASGYKLTLAQSMEIAMLLDWI